MHTVSIRYLLLLCLFGLLPGCQPDSQENRLDTFAQGSQPVVYGEDNRTDYYAHPDEALRQLTAESIVALVPPSDLDMSDPEDIGILAPTLGSYYNLCEDQRFRDQPTAAYCSGTLIDDDLVLTAGHCVESDSECRGFRYVFNYFYEAEGELATIRAEDVYECQRLVVQRYTSTVDYAILQLDRQVTSPHQPATVRLEEAALQVGASVPIIGFGSGLPAKIDDGGQVVDARASTLDYFVATTDTFGGNSGSGVFDADLRVVGILVRGEPDYVWQDDCRVVNVLPADGGGTGEDITYVHQAIQDLCENEAWPSSRLCGGGTGDGWCDPCDSAGDCPEGWSCQSWPQAPSVTWCSSPCEGPEGCIEGHHCTDAGHCEPDLLLQCSQGDVYTFDSCRNRLDLAIDCAADQQCADATCVDRMPGDVCSGATPIEPVDQTLTGDLTLGYQDDYQGSCGGGGADRVYQFTLSEQRRLVAQASGFDTLLYLRSSCLDTASELACNDDATPPGGYGSHIAATLDPGSYYLFMDGYSSSVGSYTLALTFTEPSATPDGDTCFNATAIEPISQLLTGDLSAGYLGDTRGSCAGNGVERVYRFTVATPARLVAEATGFDTVLYLRTVCSSSSSEIACNDDATPPGSYGSHIEADLDPAEYFLFIDTWSSTTGAYQLDLIFTPTCVDSCTQGDAWCVENGVQQCLLDPATGCTYMSPIVPCASWEVCEEGACVSACVDPCEVDSRACAGDGFWICQIGEDGCPAWGSIQPCPADHVCLDGECVPVCTDACLLDERRCVSDSSYQQCQVGADGCTAWGTALTCPPQTVCEGGECLPICQDECQLDDLRCATDT
ncbi:MAG: trypsin-like peptidase domain-containing protein, partial [Bradymonadales bacterium]|nr:trypsin-like peptidase domain-containing protein [Bradymonadales bacterium]